MSSPQGQPTAAVPAKGGSKKLLVLAAAALLLASGGVVVVLRRGAAPEPAETRPVPFEPGVVELEPFVLNLADPAGDRYFRLTLRLVLDQRAVAERAASGLGQVKLRDQLLAVLSKKRAGELTRSKGKESLRAELAAAAEALLAATPFAESGSGAAPARVLEVFFTEFLLQ